MIQSLALGLLGAFNILDGRWFGGEWWAEPVGIIVLGMAIICEAINRK